MFGGQGPSYSFNEQSKIHEYSKSVSSMLFQYSESAKYLAREDVLVT